MPSSNSPSKARKGGTTTLRDSRNGKFVDAPKKTQVEVVYRTYPSAAGPKNLTPQQIKKALAAA